MDWRDIKKEAESIVKEAMGEVKEYDVELQDQIHQTVDSHEWVIYYSKAWDTVYAARENGPMYDAGAEMAEDTESLHVKDGIDGLMTRLAYCILYAACQDAIPEDWEDQY